MTYNTLVAAKSASGSVLNWVGYSKIDVPTVVDEAQYLLYSMLRVREMKTEYTFGMNIGQCDVSLPTRFLDPIGQIYDITNGTGYDQLNETSVTRARNYDSSISGTFGTNPFTTTNGSGLVSVSQTNQPFNQGSTITIPVGATVNGLTISGTFPVVSVTDTNDFIIDVGGPTDTVANASSAGGGAGIIFTGNNLIAGSPVQWGVWDEKIHFDVALVTVAQMKLLYFRRPPLLSATNLTNFLTDRYPKLMRVACLASAAEFMKDDGEYQKQTQALAALVMNTAIENDMIYRGAILGTDTP